MQELGCYYGCLKKKKKEGKKKKQSLLFACNIQGRFGSSMHKPHIQMRFIYFILKCQFTKQSKVLHVYYCSNVVAEGAVQGEFPF